jgi:hypothetical protein
MSTVPHAQHCDCTSSEMPEIISSGNTTFPRLLDIFLPWESQMIPWSRMFCKRKSTDQVPFCTNTKSTVPHSNKHRTCNTKNTEKCNYHNSGHYPLSCLLLKTQRFRDWIPSPFSGGTYSVGSNRQSYSISVYPLLGSIYWAQLNRCNLKTETGCSLQNLNKR